MTKGTRSTGSTIFLVNLYFLQSFLIQKHQVLLQEVRNYQ